MRARRDCDRVWAERCYRIRRLTYARTEGLRLSGRAFRAFRSRLTYARTEGLRPLVRSSDPGQLVVDLCAHGGIATWAR